MHLSPPSRGMRKIFACGIRNPGLKWNPEYSSRNSESHRRLESRIQVPLTNTGIQYPESGIRIVESRFQHCLGLLVQCVVESRTDLWCNSSSLPFPSLPFPLPLKKNWFKKQNLKAISFYFKKFLERFSLVCLRCEVQANYVMTCLHLCYWYIY